MQYTSVQYSTVQYSTVNLLLHLLTTIISQCSTVQYSKVLYCTALYYTILYCRISWNRGNGMPSLCTKTSSIVTKTVSPALYHQLPKYQPIKFTKLHSLNIFGLRLKFPLCFTIDWAVPGTIVERKSQKTSQQEASKISNISLAPLASLLTPVQIFSLFRLKFVVHSTSLYGAVPSSVTQQWYLHIARRADSG